MSVPASTIADCLNWLVLCASVLLILFDLLFDIKFKEVLYASLFLAQIMFICTSLICSAIERKQ